VPLRKKIRNFFARWMPVDRFPHKAYAVPSLWERRISPSARDCGGARVADDTLGRPRHVQWQCRSHCSPRAYPG
jgi:hypothetical protein